MMVAHKAKASLAISLLLSYPTFTTWLRGDVTALTAAVRYLVGLGFAWLAVSGVSYLLDTFVPPEGGDGQEVAPTAERSSSEQPSRDAPIVGDPNPEPQPPTLVGGVPR